MATLRLYTTSYGTPGDVEHFDVEKPSNLADWITLATESKESGFFAEVTAVGGKKCAVNTQLVERAIVV